MKKIMSVLLTLSMLLAVVLPMGAASAEENIQIPLTYHDSIPCKVSDGGGSYDKLYPLDGVFSTSFKSAAVVGGYYTVAFDGEYELSTMKIYQDYGNADYSRLNKVYVSDNGTDFTEVALTSISATSWLNDKPETDYVQLVRVDYTFPEGITAKYLKVTNDLTNAVEFRLNEMFIYGTKQIEPARLSGLEASIGELSPAFSPETTNYTLTIDSADLAAPVISATAAEGSKVTRIEQPAESNNYTASVLVGGEGLKETVYKVKVVSTVVPTELAIKYHDSTTCVVSDGGGTYDNNYPLDRDFTTFYKSQEVTGGYYTVALDGTYELSSMKIYQGYARFDYSRMNKVYISEDGKTFTEVTDVSISATDWMTNEETNFTTLARIDYVFSAGTKAKFVKITNDLAGSTQVAMAEIRIYGKKYVRPARLSGLKANMGELSPIFDAATTYYTLKINSANLAAPVISATAAEGSEVTSIEQPAESNNYTASVLVGGEGLKETVYKVKVVSPLSATALTLKYHSSVAGKTGTDVNNAIDGKFATFFDAGTLPKMTDGFYIVALDDSYELTNMKLYQDIGQESGDFTYAYNVVEISDDGINFTPVKGVSITQSGWLNNKPETNNVQLARVDYTFPVNTKAKYVKITNNSELIRHAFRISELFVYGTLPSAKLSALSAARGTLSPAFNAGTETYTLTAGNMAQGVPSLSAEAFKGYNATVVNASAENDYTYTITVTGAGVAEKTYTVKLHVLPEIYAEASLSAQTVNVSVDVTLYEGDVTLVVAKYDKSTSKKLLDLSVVKKSEAVNNILTAKEMKLDTDNETMQGMLFSNLAELKPLQPIKTTPDKYR